ncbi:hypothetical protein [Paraburkholderia acidipaludis]|uniref:hypothetical protein n=1 Tax=Paraburkholderia acidipaludis TaxID=660537 RepID=UPI0005BCF097|nr:hypothetical protein [Paraburkholderia acidipaludis]
MSERARIYEGDHTTASGTVIGGIDVLASRLKGLALHATLGTARNEADSIRLPVQEPWWLMVTPEIAPEARPGCCIR